MKIDIHQPSEPPAHLSQSAKQWWRTTVDRYVLEEHHIRLLQLLCESWDRAQEAREQLAQDGLTVVGREGGLRPHPCVAIERDSRLAVARLVRELDLDTEPPVSERIGPAALFSNREDAMPAKLRAVKDRRPSFSAEALALFAELERTRGGKAFSDGARQLARLLNLTSEFWTGNTPCDRSKAPNYPPHCQASTDWHTCRAVRRQLLAALEQA